MISRPSFFSLLALLSFLAPALAEERGDWQVAHQRPAPSAAEAKALMKKWAEYVVEHHMRRDGSQQSGMVYEYFDVAKQGKFDQFVQGEALDTMHDGAWLIAAFCTAHRATGDPYYKEQVTKWQLPFYLQMLNHSHVLFSAKRNDARPNAPPFDKEHGLIEGEKGFVPYYWDNGGSVSLERRRDKNPLAIAPSVDHLAGMANPNFLLDGHSLGSSNHLAQDLGIMLLASWEMLQASNDEADKKLAAQVAEAAKNLHECRMRHHGFIPMCAAPHARIAADKSLLDRLESPAAESHWKAGNHFTAATIGFKPGQKYHSPGFMDNQEYLYYAALAKTGKSLDRPLAFRLVYDAVTEPLMFDRYYDETPRPPGINRFDLYPFVFIDGKPEHLRSQKKAAFQKPVPIGSRMGPQTMVVCGWALQSLRQHSELWEEGMKRSDAKRFDGLPKSSQEVAARIERELAGGLRTWEAIFAQKGYIPTSIDRSPDWDCFSDSGGYAHLIKAAALWLELTSPKTEN